jgi:hypothetical protein
MDMTCTLPAKMRELSVLLPHTDVIHLIATHPKILSVNVGVAVSRNLARLWVLGAKRLGLSVRGRACAVHGWV